MLKQRVITAVILLAALAGALWAGATVFAAAMSLLLGAGAFEWLRLAQHSAAVSILAAIAFGLSLFGLEAAAALAPPLVAAAAALALLAWLGIVAVLVRAERSAARIPPGISSLLCVLLLGSAATSAMYLLRHGVVLLLSALAIVWIADTAAYFAGRRWGKAKLARKISPGKTWAGAFGALVAVLALASIAALLAPDWPIFTTVLLRQAPPVAGLVILAVLVVLSIVGDLFESLLKRQAGAKDSGTLLPGHGGVLDRIDALLPVLPAAALIIARMGT